MSKLFQSLIDSTLQSLNEAPEDPPEKYTNPADPNDVVNPGEQGSALPSQDDTQDSNTGPVTREGTRFLVELALKALSIDPSVIPPHDKAIFNNEVTNSNAEEILKKIQEIVATN